MVKRCLRSVGRLMLMTAILWSTIAPAMATATTQSNLPVPAPASVATIDDPTHAVGTTAPGLPLDETFVQRAAAAGGEQTLFLSPTPLNYRDPSGAWRPIDADFTTVADGFANETNVLRIRARADQVAVAAQVAADQIVWQPTALTAEDRDGAHGADLARVTGATRAVAAGNVIRYAGGWTAPGITDEVVAGPGHLEHNVLFARAPLTATRATTLTLHAQLRLPSGLRPTVAGVEQTGAFSTAGTVDLRDRAGNPRLTLMPAQVFEQRRPQESITARYHFVPVDAVTWRVEMSTPVAWWRDEARTYPVVWDPAFAVVGNTQLTEVIGPRNGIFPICLTYDTAKEVGVGRNGTCGEHRLVVKFNGLSPALFPPEFTITRAQLVMAPVSGWQRPLPNGAPSPVDTWVDVFAAANDATTWPGPAEGTQLCTQEYLTLRDIFGKSFVQSCDIQRGDRGVVRDWINGGPNHGLLLKPLPTAQCGWRDCGFVTLPKTARWRARPTIQTDAPALEGTGIGLVIHYRGATLPTSEPFYIAGNPHQSGVGFDRTDHGYLLPDTNSAWTAVGVRALRDTVDLNAIQTISGSFGHPAWMQKIGVRPDVAKFPVVQDSAYTFPLSVVRPNCLGSDSICNIHSPGTGTIDSTNFVLLRGNWDGQEVRVGAINPASVSPDGYALEVAPSQPFANIPPNYATAAYDTGVTFSQELDITTDHLLTVLNLPLLKDTLARISIDWDIPGMSNPTASVQAHLFNPILDQTGRAKEASGGPITREEAFSHFVPAGGDYGLVLELPGDETPIDANLDDPAGFENVADRPLPQTINVTVTVTVCPLRMEPSDKGCDDGNTPDFSQGLNWIAVGNYRIYSPAGFVCNMERFPDKQVYPTCANGAVENDKACPDEWCARRYGADGKRYFATITWQDMTERLVVVVGNEDDIEGKYLLSANHTLGRLRSGAAVRLRGGGPGPGSPLPGAPRLDLWARNQLRKSSGVDALTASCDRTDCIGLPLSPNDRANLTELVNVEILPNGAPQATYVAKLSRPLDTADGRVKQQFDVTWSVGAEGYRGRLDAPAGDGPLATRVSPSGQLVAAARIAGLTYYFGNQWGVHFQPGEMSGYFDSLRNDNGYLKQDAALGGAMARAVYIILPFGKGAAVDDGFLVCQDYCADIRAVDDTWERPNRNWKMPDVSINQLPPDGVVAAQQAAADVGFSFKTFGARVSIVEMECPGSSNHALVQVIHGETSLAMPGMGTAGGGVAAEFDLCETSLRRVKMSFRPPLPGIPVAYPPVMYVTLFQGTVDILPEFARITLDIGFYVGVVAPRLIDGTGSIIIDTRGRFDLVLDGRVLGIGDTHGNLWVAWQKLDLGARLDNAVPNADDWIFRGTMGAHVWLGQGWQHMYHWLPDDDQLHFTADFATMARLPIKAGALIDDFPLVIPPVTIRIQDNMQLAAGQFCAGDNCSQAEIGMKAKRQIMGYDAGIYIDIADCPDAVVGLGIVAPPVLLGCTKFIVGSDSHILLDQYGGPQSQLRAAAGNLVLGNQVAAETLNRHAVADPTAATVQTALPEVVANRTSSVLVALAWARGAPALTLIRPDGVEITASNAASLGMTVTTADNETILATTTPMPGVWQARIDNVTPEDDYHLAYFANKSTPALEFTQPAAPVARTHDNPTYRIEWTPPPHAEQLRLSLTYTGLEDDLLNEGQEIGGVIGQQIDPSQGFYDWDLRPLPSGQYRISARLEDKAGAVVSALGDEQFIGVATSDALGVLSYTDEQGPPPLDPAQVTSTPVDGGMLLCWPVPPTLDLAEYRLDYMVRDPIGGRTLAERLPADVRYATDGSARQCTRMVGLVDGKSRVEFGNDPAHGIRVRDASGNYSAPVKPADFTAAFGEIETPPAFVISGTLQAGNPVLMWAPASGARWELLYAKEGIASPLAVQSGADQGSSPIMVDDAQFNGMTTVTGLERGRWYSFAARAFAGDEPYAPPSPLSNHVWLLLSDGVDADGDGCADDWQTAHSMADTTGDADGDALPTRDECRLGTLPDRVDSDHDGWWDGEEVAFATDPLDPLSFPQLTPDSDVAPLPRLALDATTLVFHGFAAGPDPDAQTVAIYNLGGGDLQPAAQSDQSWLHAEIADQEVRIAVSTAGLVAGRHRGVITVSGGAGVLQSPRRVAVEVQLVASVPGVPGDDTNRTYLPFVVRR